MAGWKSEKHMSESTGNLYPRNIRTRSIKFLGASSSNEDSKEMSHDRDAAFMERDEYTSNAHNSKLGLKWNERNLAYKSAGS